MTNNKLDEMTDKLIEALADNLKAKDDLIALLNRYIASLERDQIALNQDIQLASFDKAIAQLGNKS